jgi:hypothetical protein
MGAGKRAVVVELQRPNRRTRVRGPRSAFVVGMEAGEALVDYPGNPHGALRARTTLGLDVGRLHELAANRREVLLVFESERSDRPIIVGLLDAQPEETPDPTAESPLPPEGDTARSREALIDGRRVVLEARDEIELRCGEASITLRRNGRVVIRGVYVETRSRGVNRIKGGSVQIN